ncbi:MAG: tetratricopeptide repeat protein [Thermodesulfovibrionales bacterium]|nr:tetratricopeptide repeat protein [Thermodesulfovibrionales bacterium]
MAVWSTDKIGWSRTLRLGYKCATNGDYENAIRYYKEALKEGNNEVLIYNNLADTYMNAGQTSPALICAEDAINRARGEAVPYVTLGEIYQAKGEHDKAVDCILKAQEIFEASVPELKDMVFDSIEEVIKKLPTRIKFDIASKDWIRIIYLVKSLRSNYQKEVDYIRRGVSWEFLLDIRKKSLSSIGQKYLWSKEKLGIKGNDAITIANTYGAMSAITGSHKVMVVGKEKECSRIQISACWRYSVIKNLELDKDPGWVKCSCMCAEYINAVTRSINPNASFEFSSTFADGHKYCEGTFKIRTEELKMENEKLGISLKNF